MEYLFFRELDKYMASCRSITSAKRNKYFLASERGTIHLCRISEKGLHEKVDNDWVLNNDTLAELIFGQYAVKPIAEGGKTYVRYRNKQST